MDATNWFLVESYRPDLDADALVRHARRLVGWWGPDVHCRSGIAVPDDGSLLLTVTAATAHAAERAAAGVGLHVDRITAAVVSAHEPTES